MDQHRTRATLELRQSYATLRTSFFLKQEQNNKDQLQNWEVKVYNTFRLRRIISLELYGYLNKC